MTQEIDKRVTDLEGLAQGQEAITRLLTTMLEHHQDVIEKQDGRTAEHESRTKVLLEGQDGVSSSWNR